MIARKHQTVDSMSRLILQVKHEISLEERSLSAKRGRLTQLQKEFDRLKLLERVK